MHWYLIGGIAAGFALLAGRHVFRRRSQQWAANATGLVPVRDLTHIPEAMQRSALWMLADGGFERRVVHGVVSRTYPTSIAVERFQGAPYRSDMSKEDVDVTAFDLETLRERRGEWAYLPVDPPFRIAGVVSVVVCELDRHFPHYLLKRVGRGDALDDDALIEPSGQIAKLARQGLGLARSYAAELPPRLESKPLAVALPDGWRAYGATPEPLVTLLANGFTNTLERAGRRDLVIELLDGLVLVYPAALDVVGAAAFGDLTTTALDLIDGLLASSPRLVAD